MVRRKLASVLTDFDQRITRSSNVIIELSDALASNTLPPNLSGYAHEIFESAFLTVMKSWEAFAEDAFLLYMLGKSPPKGKTPVTFANPPTRLIAENLLLPEGNDFISWNSEDLLKKRSKRFFRDGQPFYDALVSSGSVLAEARKIRNSIAHPSEAARNKFYTVVRKYHATLPPAVTPGSFLSGIVPGSAPPLVFFHQYCSELRDLGNIIIPR